jgi:hypothetical protein
MDVVDRNAVEFDAELMKRVQLTLSGPPIELLDPIREQLS